MWWRSVNEPEADAEPDVNAEETEKMEKMENTDGGEGTEARTEEAREEATVEMELQVEEDEQAHGDLLWAAHEGDISRVVDLVLDGHDVDQRDEEGRTALHWASAIGHQAVVELLLEADASVNLADENGYTALLFASFAGHVEIVDMLLQYNAVVDAPDTRGQTPLHLAIERGHLEVVESLLEADASVKVADEDGYTALHWASHFGQVGILELILEQSPFVDAPDKNEDTPLLLAIMYGHTEVIELLVRANANIGASNGALNLFLQAAMTGDVEMVRLLLDGNISANAVHEDQVTPLHWASCYGHADVVSYLLQANASVDARASDGSTPLHRASENGKVDVVELLLKAAANVDAIGESGDTALHRASEKGRVQVVELLLKANCNIDAADKGGETPLFKACYYKRLDIVRLLLESGADIHAKDTEGLEVLHRLLEYRESEGISTNTLETLKVLVTYGATWDTKCDELVAEVRAWDEAPALALCMQLWAQEHTDKFELTDIPIEIVSRGLENTQAFVNSIKTSLETVLRRKICLVGHSCAGKTSFVKSIKANAPQLVHIDNRTIGIDHVPLRFEQFIASRNDTKIHEVTFWDFAGQDAYQVAHSLFFSPRTLFFVFVDLEAFTIAYKQAVIFGSGEGDETKLLDEYIEHTVLHWIHLIVARQPAAEFVFIATKEDSVKENDLMKSVLKRELESRLHDIEATARAMKLAAVHQNGPKQPGQGAHGLVKEAKIAGATTATGLSQHWRGRASHNKSSSDKATILFVSCWSPESVKLARQKVEELIVKSNLSVLMPEVYSKVLKRVIQIREEAAETNIAARIKRVFAPVDTIVNELQVDKALSQVILQALHDLGDVLWYEDLGVALFQNVVILDPLLLIDFIRQVINHNHTGIMMAHLDLMAKPFWRDLKDPSSTDLVRSMKQLMQCFHLVYSEADDRKMAWDSHLIVPASWQTKDPVWRHFPAGKLQLKSAATDAPPVRVRVYWEYHFAFGLSSNLFDHLVVASVTPWFMFEAGPDWIWYQDKTKQTVCRVMIDRERRSLHRTILVEAVIAKEASDDEESDLWAVFKGFVCALVAVVKNNPGLAVSCHAIDTDGKEHDLKTLLNRVAPPKPLSWMPPAALWKSFRLDAVRRAESIRRTDSTMM